MAEVDTSRFATGLRHALDGIKKGSPAFAYAGHLPRTANPRLTVPQLGTAALPIKAIFSEQLRVRCSKAPFGKGSSTIVDESVRRTWQLEPAQFELLNRAEWDKAIDDAKNKACAAMGVNAPKTVRAELYKLLLYEPGGHFAPHRDTEKSPGMFGSLVVTLPSAFAGGELCVQHGGRTSVFDQAKESAECPSFVAFYADCTHEVRTLRSGYRVALVYNLVRKAAKGTAAAAAAAAASEDHLGGVDAARAALEDWDAALSADRTAPLRQPWSRYYGKPFSAVTDKLVYVLDHKYTSASITSSGAAALKGRDAGAVEALAAAAAQLPGRFEVYLARFAKQVDGDAPSDGDWDRPAKRSKGGGKNAIDIKSIGYSLSAITPAGAPALLAPFRLPPAAALLNRTEECAKEFPKEFYTRHCCVDPAAEGAAAAALPPAEDENNNAFETLGDEVAWRAESGGSSGLEEPDWLCNHEKASGDPDQQMFEGYTGNEGAPLTHWYTRWAVVVWPAEFGAHRLLDHATFDDAIARLGELTAAAAAGGAAAAEQKAAAEAAAALSGALLARAACAAAGYNCGGGSKTGASGEAPSWLESGLSGVFPKTLRIDEYKRRSYKDMFFAAPPPPAAAAAAAAETQEAAGKKDGAAVAGKEEGAPPQKARVARAEEAVRAAAAALGPALRGRAGAAFNGSIPRTEAARASLARLLPTLSRCLGWEAAEAVARDAVEATMRNVGCGGGGAAGARRDDEERQLPPGRAVVAAAHVLAAAAAEAARCSPPRALSADLFAPVLRALESPPPEAERRGAIPNENPPDATATADKYWPAEYDWDLPGRAQEDARIVRRRASLAEALPALIALLHWREVVAAAVADVGGQGGGENKKGEAEALVAALLAHPAAYPVLSLLVPVEARLRELLLLSDRSEEEEEEDAPREDNGASAAAEDTFDANLAAVAAAAAAAAAAGKAQQPRQQQRHPLASCGAWRALAERCAAALESRAAGFAARPSDWIVPVQTAERYGGGSVWGPCHPFCGELLGFLGDPDQQRLHRVMSAQTYLSDSCYGSHFYGNRGHIRDTVLKEKLLGGGTALEASGLAVSITPRRPRNEAVRKEMMANGLAYRQRKVWWGHREDGEKVFEEVEVTVEKTGPQRDATGDAARLAEQAAEIREALQLAGCEAKQGRGGGGGGGSG